MHIFSHPAILRPSVQHGGDRFFVTKYRFEVFFFYIFDSTQRFSQKFLLFFQLCLNYWLIIKEILMIFFLHTISHINRTHLSLDKVKKIVKICRKLNVIRFDQIRQTHQLRQHNLRIDIDRRIVSMLWLDSLDYSFNSGLTFRSLSVARTLNRFKVITAVINDLSAFLHLYMIKI